MLPPALDVGMTLGTEAPAGLEAEAIASPALCPEWILEMIARNCKEYTSSQTSFSASEAACEGREECRAPVLTCWTESLTDGPPDRKAPPPLPVEGVGATFASGVELLTGAATGAATG